MKTEMLFILILYEPFKKKRKQDMDKSDGLFTTFAN